MLKESDIQSSRKELTGWGDSSQSYRHEGGIKSLPNTVDKTLSLKYKDDLYAIIDMLLEGLYLSEHMVRRHRYNTQLEDVEDVEDTLRNILFRRAAKKLSHINRQEKMIKLKYKLDSIHVKEITKDLIEYIIHFYSNQMFEKFYLRIEKLVRNYSRKLPGFIKDSEYDDLLNIACIEFIETLRSWNPESNPKLWPLAFSRVNGAMRDHIRYLTKADPSRIYNWVTDAAYMYLAINRNKEEFAGKVIAGVTLKEALAQLNPNERKVVTLKGVQDLTLSEIGKQINLSESQVSRIYNAALGKLKKIIS